jgi:hypothetical protein
MNNYTVLYISDLFNVPEAMIIWAENSDHAEEQANNLIDGLNSSDGMGFEVVSIVETDVTGGVDNDQN